MKKVLIVAFVLALVMLVSVAVFAAVPSLTIPGVNAKDDMPKGCADCHVKVGNNDYTVLAGMKKLVAAGKHPKASDTMLDELKDCYTCHKAGAAAGTVAAVVHASHFTGKDNSFVKEYSGNCTWCHSVDLTKGTVGIKGK